ncbi:MAG: FadR/GntR family transcriptional regulator [Lachnospiraceae bacterium]
MPKKEKLSGKVTKQILDMISVQHKYDIGDKLPNEQELSQTLGVSRNTLREAILYLVTQNVLEIRRGKGTFVSDTSKVTNDFGFDELKYTHLKLRDLYELRLMIEPQMGYYAAQRATQEEIDEIIRLGEAIEESREMNDENAEGNMRFHNAIAQATHNEFGIKLSEILSSALIAAFQDSNLKQVLYDDTMMDHTIIMEFLKMRDPEGVKQALYLHLKHSMRDYKVK